MALGHESRVLAVGAERLQLELRTSGAKGGASDSVLCPSTSVALTLVRVVRRGEVMTEHFAERRKGACDDSNTALDGAPQDNKADTICSGKLVALKDGGCARKATVAALQRMSSSFV